MVLKLKQYCYITRAYVNLNRQHEKRLYLCYQAKHLSNMVSAQRKQGFLKNKFDDIIAWYDEFTGMDEVRAAQKRVLEDEENFRTAQEERRKVLIELTEVQMRLKDLYSELDNTNRGDERYVVLVTQEHKLLKEEKLIKEKFDRAEKLERDSFASLSSSVKLSHEKERAQSERTKYWSIIGSVLGTVIGLLGSSINNHFKMGELKQLIKNSTHIQLMECINSYVETNEQIIEKYKESMKLDEKNNLNILENLLKAVNNRLSEVEASVKSIEEKSEKNRVQILSNDSGTVVTVPIEKLEEKLEREHNNMKMLLVAVAMLSIVMPVISRYT